MKILIIRHGDPDYAHDCLTERGRREAELLADRICAMDIKAFYVSPLGRARETASFTLKRLNRTATECQWLREFAPRIRRPDMTDGRTIAWDWLPQDWTEEEDFYHRDLWMHHPVMKEANVPQEYQWITENMDRLLAEYGYVRDKNIYRVERANRDTIAFFCHFGLESVLIGHLTGISPMLLWHHTVAAPTSVTTIYTEERRKGIALFRVGCFGDTSHLYLAGEEPSFSARFCETYDCQEERHD